jgi:hypothetical protein
LAAFDTIIEVPAEVAQTIAPLAEVSITNSCRQCGNIATVHCSSNGEQIPDLYKCRSEVGTNEFASEVLPGYLWVGSAQAVKHRSIALLRFTLIINCAKNMKNPHPQPPHFRCKVCPLPESPSRDFSNAEITAIMDMLERCYDWAELERLAPEKVAESDHKPAANQKPVKSAKAVFKHTLQADEKIPPSRVLFWSKNGKDRSCFVAAAYLIKNYGISIERALSIIKASQPAMRISEAYLMILRRWEEKYRRGIFLCPDCAEEKERKYAEKIATSKRSQDKTTLDAIYEQTISQIQSQLSHLTGDKNELALLGNPKECLVKLLTNQFTSSLWSGLLDLELSDRRINDRTLAHLFQLLADNDCIVRLRSINLRNNSFSVLAAKAMLVAYFPKITADPDKDFYLEDGLRYPDKDVHCLTQLDLSHNM